MKTNLEKLTIRDIFAARGWWRERNSAGGGDALVQPNKFPSIPSLKEK